MSSAVCTICNEAKTWETWEDTIITFANPQENYHISCLQNKYRQAVTIIAGINREGYGGDLRPQMDAFLEFPTLAELESKKET